MSKFYAVAKGRNVGIYRDWPSCQKQVTGFSGAKYKSFRTREDAESFIGMVSESNHVETAIEVKPVFKTKETRDTTDTKDTKDTVTDTVTVYTDGSCIDGVGGYGFVVTHHEDGIPYCGKVPLNPCTNQIAELYAIYMTLQYIKENVTIYTDSKYSIGCLTVWCHKWQINGWKNSKGEEVKNKDLIQSILKVIPGRQVTFRHVRAHRGDFFNEWADRLANEGRVQ